MSVQSAGAGFGRPPILTASRCRQVHLALDGPWRRGQCWTQAGQDEHRPADCGQARRQHRARVAAHGDVVPAHANECGPHTDVGHPHVAVADRFRIRALPVLPEAARDRDLPSRRAAAEFRHRAGLPRRRDADRRDHLSPPVHAGAAAEPRPTGRRWTDPRPEPLPGVVYGRVRGHPPADRLRGDRQHGLQRRSIDGDRDRLTRREADQMTIGHLIGLGISLSMGLVILGLGLHATLRDATYVLRRPALLVRSLVSMDVAMPLFAAGLAAFFNLGPAVALALVALALSPVPPYVPIQAKSGGESYAIGLLVVTTVAAT